MKSFTIGRLLTNIEFITFIGSSLLIGGRDIVDFRWARHGLTPLGYRANDNPVFSILRLTDNEVKLTVPKVVGIL